MKFCLADEALSCRDQLDFGWLMNFCLVDEALSCRDHFDFGWLMKSRPAPPNFDFQSNACRMEGLNYLGRQYSV